MAINNFITTITINISFFLIGGVVGVIGTVLTKFATDWIESKSKKREALWKRKCRLSDQVIDICTEGSTAMYNVMPGSQRHIHKVANLVEGFDKSVADDLRKYLGLWVLCAIQQAPGPYQNDNPTTEDIDFCAGIQRQAAILEDSILARARKWR